MKKRNPKVLPLSFIFLLSSFFLNHLPAQPRVLAVLPAQFGANTHFNLDNLAENCYSITLAGVTRQVSSCTFSAPIGNQVFEADTLVQEITSSDAWDVIAIMPMEWRNSANPYGDLIGCASLVNLLKEAKQKGKVIWATCAGVRVLASANIINGVKVSGRSEYSAEYIAAGALYQGANIPPVWDQNIITSTRGMYYMQENIEMISTALEKSGRNFNRFSQPPATKDRDQSNLEITLWDHQYTNEAPQGLRSVCITPDGGNLAAGYTWANPGQNSDILLVKTDVMGKLLWTKTFGGSGWEFAWSVINTRDGGYVAAGYSSSTRGLDKNINIIKIDSEGNLLWERQLGGSDSDVGRDVIQTADGSLLVAGYTTQTASGEWDLQVVKLDENGEYQWSRILGDAGPEIARSIIQNRDGNYILAGETGSTTTGNRDMLLMCLNGEGSMVWQKSYHKDNYDSGYEAIELPAGGYSLIGHGDLHGQDFLELALVKTDPAGNCLSHTFYEATTRFYDYGKSVALSPNGTLAMCGIAKKKSTRDNKLFLMLFDSDGRSLLNGWFDLPGSSWCTSLISGPDNNFIVAGQTTLENTFYQPWLLKIQNPTVTGTALNHSEGTGELRCYPNPFSDRLTIEWVRTGRAPATITVTDVMGRIVIQWITIDDQGNGIFWDGSLRSGKPAKPGCYTIRVDLPHCTSYQKVLYLH